MANFYLKPAFILALFALFLFIPHSAQAQSVKRVVVVKVDGLQGDFLDRFIKEKNPKTGKSQLPWIEQVFYKNGTRLANFYTRGMSLSAPAWSVLDTGQHLQIKGNVEYDRYTLHPYDYLNFLPFYLGYSRKTQADMPGMVVLDELKVPILSDAFQYEKRYASYQLFQRGIQWEVVGGAIKNFFPRDPKELIDEWTIGFDMRDATINQNERDITGKLTKNPEIEYFDYYTGSLDHASHHNNDIQSRLAVLKEIDKTIGKLWVAIEESPRANETAMVVVSDHGFNSDEKIYSQGFNIVKLLASAPGGGHHVITKRRLMLDYSIKGMNPFVPLITTTSNDTYYLKGQSTDYPTVLVDFDGNERSSLHFRENDLNILHILLQQLQGNKLSPEIRRAARRSFFEVVNRHRADWQKNVVEITEEIDALNRWTEAQQAIVAAQPKKFTPEEIAKGTDKEAIRNFAKAENAARDVKNYREYLRILSNLLALNPETFDAKKMKISDYIAKGAMGDRNSIYELQNYVVGLSDQGLVPNPVGGGIDFERSFKRVNYFETIKSQTVRNNVQQGIGNQPIDFISTNIPVESIAPLLKGDNQTEEDPIWLYAGADKQALILARKDSEGNQSFRYLPVANLRQQDDGRFLFQVREWDKGFPLKIYEDPNLNTFGADKTSWLNDWHTEVEWLQAAHKTQYSNGLVGLNEQLDVHPLEGFENEQQPLSADEKLIHRFRQRQRDLTHADLLLMANDHWNFDVRGFNPGGNHGSFFRVSTNSTFMLAGGATTNIPRGLTIEEPYDSLSVVPTVLRLMGKVDDDRKPNAELYKIGFRQFPGRIVKEVVHP